MLIPFDVLFKKYNLHPGGVVHLGANTGQEAEAYAAQGVNHVIWVEALSHVYAQLCEHIKRYPGSHAYCACLSDVDGQEVEFNISSNEAQSSSFLQFGTHATAHPTVKYIGKVQLKTTRLDTLFKQHCIELGAGWFLNIDLQGAELLALKGMGKLLAHFDYAYIEVNTEQLYVGCPLLNEIDSYLFEYGFERVELKMTNWNWGDALYIRRAFISKED